jgi:SAM-dependent methyltransferase
MASCWVLFLAPASAPWMSGGERASRATASTPRLRGDGNRPRSRSSCGRDYCGRRARSKPYIRGRRCNDVPASVESFDVVAVVATLHHLPLGAALGRFLSLLRPGGVLAVVGLYRARTLADHACSAAALPVAWSMRRMRDFVEIGSRTRPPRESLRDFRAACEIELPRARLRRHHLWRYNLCWTKLPEP